MTFNKSDIGKLIIINGCGYNNECKSCNTHCSRFVTNGHIVCTIDAIEPAGFNSTMGKVWVIPCNDNNKEVIVTRMQWCIPYKDPEYIVEVMF